MVSANEFEVTKDVYERAKAENPHTKWGGYYMASADMPKYFDEATLCGYGVYNCRVHDRDGKYICTWQRGGTCD